MLWNKNYAFYSVSTIGEFTNVVTLKLYKYLMISAAKYGN